MWPFVCKEWSFGWFVLGRGNCVHSLFVLRCVVIVIRVFNTVMSSTNYQGLGQRRVCGFILGHWPGFGWSKPRSRHLLSRSALGSQIRVNVWPVCRGFCLSGVIGMGDSTMFSGNEAMRRWGLDG